MRHSISRRPLFFAAALLAVSASAPAQSPDALRAQLHAYRVTHDVDIVRELSDFLAIRNRANEPGNRRNAERLLEMMQSRGVTARLLEPAPGEGGPPVVYGELMTPGATKTVVFYAHYDGQPVDTTQWLTPPWSPTLRDKPADQGGTIIALPQQEGTVNGEWRLYARSAGDDKAPIIGMLRALDGLHAAGVRPSVNLKFYFEGEEEAGSPHLASMLQRNAALLKADLWLICDGPDHQSRKQQLVFGVRGVTDAELTVYGPSRALHSGHYGNWAPNPITLLANLIASMRNDDGRILVAHYYDDVDPITAADRRALATVPAVDSALRAELELGATEANDALLVERIMLPALNLRGIRGGAIGATASNAIPVDAGASIDFRMVVHQTPEHVRQLVEAHIRAQGFFIVDHDATPAERMAHAKVIKVRWGSGYPALRTSVDLPVSRAVIRASEEALGHPVIVLPTMGGSVGMSTFYEVLHTPLIQVPTVNYDDNQHAANENLRLQNLFDSIEWFGGLMADLGKTWPGTIP